MRFLVSILLLLFANSSFSQIYGNSFLSKYHLYEIDKIRKVQFNNQVFDFNSGSEYVLRNVPLAQLENGIVFRNGMGFEYMSIMSPGDALYRKQHEKRLSVLSEYRSNRDYTFGQNSYLQKHQYKNEANRTHTFNQSLLYSRQNQRLHGLELNRNNFSFLGSHLFYSDKSGKDRRLRTDVMAMGNAIRNAFDENNQAYGVNVYYWSKPKANLRFKSGASGTHYRSDLHQNSITNQSHKLSAYVSLKKVGRKVDHEISAKHGYYENLFGIRATDAKNAFHLSTLRLEHVGRWKTLSYDLENSLSYHTSEGFIYEPEGAVRFSLRDIRFGLHAGRKWLNNLPYDRYRSMLQVGGNVDALADQLLQVHGQKEMYSLINGTVDFPISSSNKIQVSTKHHRFQDFNFLQFSQPGLDTEKNSMFTTYGFRWVRHSRELTMRADYQYTMFPEPDYVQIVPTHQAVFTLSYPLPQFRIFNQYIRMKLKSRTSYQSGYALPVYASNMRLETQGMFFTDFWISFNERVGYYNRNRRIKVDLGVSNLTNTQFQDSSKTEVNQALMALPNLSRQFVVRVSVPVL